MNYTLDFNGMNQLDYPQILLCRRNKKRYGEIFPVSELKITLSLNAPNEISFVVPEYTNGVRTPLWNKINVLKYVFVEKFGYFQIKIERLHEGNVEKKFIAGKSLEVELAQLYLNDFQVNSEDIDDESYDASNPIKFYNPLDPEHSLLHLCILKAPNWEIGHVDDVLWNKQRTFDVHNTDIYSFLMKELSQQLECLFLFDDFNRQIHCYHIDNVGKDTSVFIDHYNLAKEIRIEADASQIKNCFKVVGGDGIHINEVNPDGTDYIWLLSDADKADMSEELVGRLHAYDAAYPSKMSEYEAIMRDLQDMVDVLLELNSKAPANEQSTNWTTYSLTYLKQKRDAYLKKEDAYKTAGFGDKRTPGYSSAYLPNHNTVLAIEAEIKAREAQIAQKQAQYDAVIARRNALQDSLDLEKWLTVNGDNSLWKELALYRREQLYENQNYSITDYTGEEERFRLERELLEEAKSELIKATRPKYDFRMTMGNLLALPEFRNENVGDFTIGNYIRVGLHEDEIIRTRIVKIALNFDSLSEIEVEFSEMTELHEPMSDPGELLEKAASAASSYETVIKQRKNDSDKISYVGSLIQNGLNAALTDIYNADNMETTIDSRGILCRQFHEEKQDYEPEQMHLINNKIVFTDDNWKSARMALGKIHIVNPSGLESDAYGIIADVLIGKQILSEYMFIGNNNNTFTIDDKGFTAYSQDKQTVVKIDPNNSNGLMAVWRNFQGSNRYKTFWTDASGDLHITGKLEACRFIATNGKNTIDINPESNRLFRISKNGEDVLYFDENGNAYYKGDMTIGVLYSQNYITSGGLEGSMINLTNGVFKFANDRLTLDTDKLITYDSTRQRYTSVKGGEVECWNDDAHYEWMGVNYLGSNISSEMSEGIIHLQYNNNDRDLYITPQGISTASKGNTTAAGTIDFYSDIYGSHAGGSAMTGITVRTNGSPVALMSNSNSVVINPDANDNKGMFEFSASENGGHLRLGDYPRKEYRSGIVFYNSEAKVKITDGSNGLGKLLADSVELKAESTINGKKIITEPELDRLLTAYNRELERWEQKYDDMLAQKNREIADIHQYYSTWHQTCPSCPDCPPCP